MRHFAQWIAVVAVSGALASSAAAQTTVMMIRGPVVAVDQQASTIQVQDQSQGRTIVVQLPQDNPAIIVRRGQPVQLRDVQVGQVVEVHHEDLGGRYVAQQIEILPAPMAATTTTTRVDPATGAVTQVQSVPATPPATRIQTDSSGVTRVQTPATPAITRVQTNPAVTTTQIDAVAAPAANITVVDVHRWGPFSKLARGVGNLLFGVLEVSRNIYNTSERDGILAGLTAGTFKGVGYTIVRMGTGAYETITFPLPLPEDYRPLVQPEYPWEPGDTTGFLG